MKSDRARINLAALSELLEARVRITRYTKHIGGKRFKRFTCQLVANDTGYAAETKSHVNSRLPEETFGNARTAEAAKKDYVKQLRGRIIVLNAYADNRRRLRVPKYLSLH